MAMDLEIEEEPESEEEEAEEEAPATGGAMPAGGVELKVSLENPTIHVDKLTIKKKDE